jgi:hypothetical protein
MAAAEVSGAFQHRSLTIDRLKRITYQAFPY